MQGASTADQAQIIAGDVAWSAIADRFSAGTTVILGVVIQQVVSRWLKSKQTRELIADTAKKLAGSNPQAAQQLQAQIATDVCQAMERYAKAGTVTDDSADLFLKRLTLKAEVEGAEAFSKQSIDDVADDVFGATKPKTQIAASSANLHKIPDFSASGGLPVGLHSTTLEQVEQQFAHNAQRANLFKQMKQYIEKLKKAGIADQILIGGSFTTNKLDPNDWDIIVILRKDVDKSQLPLWQQNLLDRKLVGKNYGGDMVSMPAGSDKLSKEITAWQEKGTSAPKGMLQIDISN